MLCIQGHSADKLYLITSGIVQTLKIFSDGKESGIHFLSQDNLLGITAIFIKNSEYHFTATSITPCKVIEIDRKAFERYLLANPSELAEVTRNVNSILQNFLNFYFQTKGHSSTQQVLTFLGMLASLNSKTNDYGVEIAFPVSMKLLASSLGLSEMSINRSLAELEQQNYIARKGKRISVAASYMKQIKNPR